MASGTVSALNTGENITLGGLGVQVVFFTCFVITAGLFHLRMLRGPTPKVRSGKIPWQKHMHVLYGTSILIWVRCIFRLIEYAQGNDGYLIRHEVFLYVFDALLMWSVMLAFALIHPSEINAMNKGGNTKVVLGLVHFHPPVAISQLE